MSPQGFPAPTPSSCHSAPTPAMPGWRGFLLACPDIGAVRTLTEPFARDDQLTPRVLRLFGHVHLPFQLLMRDEGRRKGTAFDCDNWSSCGPAGPPRPHEPKLSATTPRLHGFDARGASFDLRRLLFSIWFEIRFLVNIGIREREDAYPHGNNAQANPKH